MILNGKEYTIGKIGESTVEVIRWDNDGQTTVTVEWKEDETVRDVVAKAYPSSGKEKT